MYIPIPHFNRMTKKQIEELKEEINKTEYEKAREPLNKEIRELNKEIFDLKRIINGYQMLLNDISKCFKEDYIKLVVNTNPLEIQFGEVKNIKTTESQFTTITLNIKEEFKKTIHRKLCEILNKIGE